ncbi:MAG: GAF domain-containing protein, partial [Acetobacteraceae bacterium]|nr:GAF domain-containing protein [Acetobacteraceae bacterium]
MGDDRNIDALQRRLAEAETALREKGEIETQLHAALEALRASEARLGSDLAGLRRLYELNARLANEPDLRARLEQIIEAANSFLGTDRGCIQLLSEDGERLEMFAYRGYEPTSPFILHFLQDGSKPAFDAARAYGQRLVIEDVASFPGLAGTVDREIGLAEQILATQSTPMVTRGGEIVGVLSNQFRTKHRPTEGELRLIDLLAWNAAEIVERHHAEAALRVSEQNLREKEVWLAAQKEAFGAAMNGAPLETSLGILTDAIVNAAEDGRRCAFYIADDKGSRLSHVVGMGEEYAKAVDGFEISPESLACGLAVAQGKRVVTRDVLEDPRWQPWCWLAREYGYRGCWSFPVETSAGTLVGSFAMYFSEPRDAYPRDLELAATMTQTAAIIISRHKENEERLRSEERLSQFGEASQDLLWIRRAETLQWVYLTPAFETIYGLSREEA